jgi:hypothetical protein
MSEEIRVRVDVRDLRDRDYCCELSSTAAGSQIELARLMGEAFRVLSHHLVAPPNDHLILQTFALAALDSDLIFADEEVD